MKSIITVVIPTYKRPQLLLKCLDALAKQNLDMASFEVIVVSDGPDDETAKVLRNWLKSNFLNVHYYETATKNGPAAARNLGWKSAKSSFIAFTDDDCLPSPTWLQEFLKRYNNEEKIVFSGFTSVPLSKEPTDYELNISHLETAEFITANCACTVAALQSVGGFDERFKAAWREDSDLQFKFISKNIPVIKVHSAVVIHPVRQAAWGTSIKEQKKGMYNALLYKKHPKFYKQKIQSQLLWNYYLINLLWIIIICAAFLGYKKLLFIAVLGQLILLSQFIYKRMKHSRKSVNHFAEMLFTSLVIPSLSVYWQIRGFIKFRKTEV